MTPQTILEIFDQLADDSNAVEKVRELILRLAMSARLVDQNPSEPSGVEVFKAIQQMRAKRLRPKESVRFSPKDLIKAGDDVHLPYSWYRCVIGEVCDLKTGATPPTQEPRYFGGKIRWLVSGDINQGEIFECDGRISELGLANTNCKIIPTNSVLIALNGQGKTRASVALLRVEATLNQSLVAIIPYSPEQLLPEFLFWNLRSRYKAIRHVTGQEQRRGLNMKLVGNLSLPIPPVEEQRRIVARIQELMKLCEKLEVQQKERNVRYADLTRAAVARFNEAPTPANLNFLFHKSYAVPTASLRETILSLAVQGKLTPQNPNDESVDSSLAIADEMRRKTAITDHRADENALPLISTDDKWEVPDTWSWRALADLVLFIDYRGKTPHKLSSGIRLLTAKNVRKGKISISPAEFISEKEYATWMTRGLPKTGDVLFTTEAPMGNAAVVHLEGRFALAQRVICFHSYGALDPAFLVLQILNSSFQLILEQNATGMTAKGIKAGRLKHLPVAVPPLPEQHRIVAKVNQLMGLLDSIEMHLTELRAKSQELLDAFVYSLLKPVRVEVHQDYANDIQVNRAVIGCYVISQLSQGPSFGRTALMKVLYLSEVYSGISQGWQPVRQAAGPYDPAIEEFESLGVQNGWFSLKKKTLSNGHEMVQYQIKSGLEAKIAEANSVLRKQKAEFDRLLNLFRNKTTEEAEIIATLFAAWNDLLIDGKSPSDDEIIREVRENWHYKKERFTPALLTRWLNWLRQQSVIPRGLAPRTRQQLKLGLS